MVQQSTLHPKLCSQTTFSRAQPEYKQRKEEKQHCHLIKFVWQPFSRVIGGRVGRDKVQEIKSRCSRNFLLTWVRFQTVPGRTALKEAQVCTQEGKQRVPVTMYKQNSQPGAGAKIKFVTELSFVVGGWCLIFPSQHFLTLLSCSFFLYVHKTRNLFHQQSLCSRFFDTCFSSGR